MVAGVRLDVGPVGDVEFLVYCKPPLLSCISNTTSVSLGLEIFSIKCVAIWLVNHILDCPNLVGKCICAYYTAAKSLIGSFCVGHRALAWSFYVATFAFLAIFCHVVWVKIEPTWDVWVCWVALVWSFQFIILLHYLRYAYASGFVNIWVKSEASLAVLAIVLKVIYVRF